MILTIKHKKEIKIVLFDDEDFDLISQYQWQLDDLGYVIGKLKGSKKRANVLMHRLILNLTDPEIKVDHKFHDKLDNRKENLRICSVAQNNYNKKKHRRNTTGFKGVYREDFAYVANIGFEMKLIRVGRFRNIEDAAKAYDSAAVHFFGEFAHLNFPNETPLPYSHYQNISNSIKAINLERKNQVELMLFAVLDKFEMITPQLIKEFINSNDANLTFNSQLRNYCNVILKQLVQDGKLTTKERSSNLKSEPIVYIRL